MMLLYLNIIQNQLIFDELKITKITFKKNTKNILNEYSLHLFYYIFISCYRF